MWEYYIYYGLRILNILNKQNSEIESLIAVEGERYTFWEYYNLRIWDSSFPADMWYEIIWEYENLRRCLAADMWSKGG